MAKTTVQTDLSTQEPSSQISKPLQFNTNESSFQAGYLAAGVSKTGKVATYGGLNIPPVTIFMDGFAKVLLTTTRSRAKNVTVLGWDIARKMEPSLVDSLIQPRLFRFLRTSNNRAQM
jgi:hypothetical protein